MNEKQRIYYNYLCKLYQEKKIERLKTDFKCFAEYISKEYDSLVDMSFPTYIMTCEVLQALIEDRLFILKDDIFIRVDHCFLNACPGWGKSYIATRLLSIWYLAKYHLINFIITASEKNRKKIMFDISILLQLKNFKNIFKDFSLLKNNDSEKVSSKNGWLNMNPSRSDITGNRGNLFIFDDFDKPTHIGRKEFETSKEYLKMYLTRGFKNQITKMLVIMQRIAINDTTEYLQNNFDNGNIPYVKIKIPYKYIEDTIYTYYIKNKQTNKIEKKEWFFKEDTFSNIYFNEEKWNTAILWTECQGDIIKRETQYQQNPQKYLNSIIKKEWFNYYDDYLFINFVRIFITGDTAQKAKESSDYTVYCCWGITDDNKIYLLDMLRDKWELHEIQKNAIAIYNNWKNGINGKNKYPAFYIEDKVSGTGLIQELRRTTGIAVYEVPRNKDIILRLSEVVCLIETGRVYLPKLRYSIIEPFIEECINIRRDMSHRHDDIVTNLIDGLNIGLLQANKNWLSQDLSSLYN